MFIFVNTWGTIKGFKTLLPNLCKRIFNINSKTSLILAWEIEFLKVFFCKQFFIITWLNMIFFFLSLQFINDKFDYPLIAITCFLKSSIILCNFFKILLICFIRMYLLCNFMVCFSCFRKLLKYQVYNNQYLETQDHSLCFDSCCNN